MKNKLHKIQEIIKFKRFVHLTMLILFISASSLTVFSQTAREAVKKNVKLTNVTVQQLVDNLGTEFKYSFFIVDDQIRNTVVSVDLKKAAINEILDNAFFEKEVGYSIKDNNITISYKKNSSRFKNGVRKVTGFVTDQKGEAIIGASVMVKGTTNGIITNVDGSFNLTNVPENSTLRFSFIGMKTQEVNISGKNQLNVKLVDDAIILQEIVTVGYGTQKKSSVTGAVATIKSEDLTVVPASNVTGVLAGRLPGLIVNQNEGRPGSDAASINIRGFGANNSSGAQGESALVIVDGVERSFSQLDPNEIESITVLKDASAAVYGVRAGAGVILVTTKRGKTGKPLISYNGSMSFTENTRYPELANFKEYEKAASLHRRGDEWEIFKAYITPERLASLRDGSNPGTNWNKEVANNFAPMEQHNINMRGGSEEVKYFISGGYLNQGSRWKSGDYGFERFNASANIDARISKNLSTSIDLGMRREQRESSPADGNGDFGDMIFAHPAFPASIPENRLVVVNSSNAQSPVAATTKSISGYNKTVNTVLNGSFAVKYKIPGIEGLTVDARSSFGQTFTFGKRLEKPFNLWAYNGTNFVGEQISNGGIVDLTENSYRFLRSTTNISINYSHQFGNHGISALLLSERVKETAESVSAVGNNVISAAVPYLSFSNPDNQSCAGTATEFGRTGIVGRLNYEYLNKYLLELSFRRDKSPYFPKNSRTGFFPGVSFGWIMSKEAFMTKADFISNLKLRASASKLGNDGTNAFDYIEGFDVLSSKNGYVFNDKYQAAIRTRGVANQNITWQNSNLFNVGVDAGFFKNRLYLEFDVFYRLRYGLLAVDDQGVVLPTTIGADLPFENIESRDNRGFELNIGYKETIGDFKYNVSGNVSWAREKYVKQLETVDYADKDLERINRQSGNWVNRTFGYQFDGFFTQEDIANAKIDYDGSGNSTLRAGDIRLKDYNLDGKIDQRDQVLIGRSNVPEIMFGLNAQFEYKKFDFTMFWQGAANFDQNMNNTERGMQLVASGPRTPYKYIVDKLWSVDNKENAEFPSDLDGPRADASIDKYRINSNYVRLKNLVIGYTLPITFVNKVGVDKCRVYISGTNLITLDALGFYPIDPEVGNGANSYPIQRVYSFGINLSF
jgi:TonB-linked SusC/RagA family outer membrane protein